MADRFPLILNTSANQIQEIASGDNLDLTGTGITNAGQITAGNVTIGAATTDLIVNGDARITGILTIGTSSLKLDGPNNLVNVGTALTLGHTQGLQFHTQNLHSAGFEVNQINVSGASTMGGDVTFTGDNYNVLWDKSQDQLEFADNAKASFGTGGDLFVFHNGSNSYVQDAGQGILFLDCSETNITKYGSNHNMAKFIGGGAVELYHNNTKRFETTTSGVTVTGDGTFTGNVSIGGTLTYEDVTNIDSVGIITARQGIRVPDGSTGANYISAGASDDIKLYHDGSTASIIKTKTGDQLSLQSDLFWVRNSANSESIIKGTADGAVELYQDNSRKFFTISNGVQATNRIIVGEGNAQRGILSGDANSASVGSIGDITFNFIRNSQIKARIDGNDFQIPTDNGKIELGASQDLSIYHNGTHSYLDNATGNMYIRGGGGQILMRANSSEDSVVIKPDGSVELYYDGTKHFETTGGGVNVIGNFVADCSVTVDPDSYTNHFITGNIADGSGWGAYGFAFGQGTGKMAAFGVASSLYMAFGDGSNANSLSTFQRVTTSGAVELYHDGTKKFETSANGILIPDGQRIAFDTDNYITCNNTANTLEFVVGGTGIGEYFSGGFRFNDSQQIRIGSGNDTRFYHSGTHSYIKHTGTGNFYIDVNTNDYFQVTGEESETIISAQHNGSVELFENGTKRLETTSSGVNVTGQLVADNGLKVPDGKHITLGTDNDFRFYHDGSNAAWNNTTGNNYLYGGGGHFYIRPVNAEQGINVHANGNVELFYDNGERLETTSTGVSLFGSDHNASGTFEVNDGVDGDCFRALNGGAIKWCLGTTANTGNATVSFDARTYSTNKARLHKWTSPNRDGGSYGQYSESWYDGGAYRVITALSVGFAFDHHVVPGANNTYDLGTSSLRWRNIFTNDLNLSNEGGANEVDGTWGNYTIQEGESDLFLINKRSGKKYKFNLTEVS